MKALSLNKSSLPVALSAVALVLVSCGGETTRTGERFSAGGFQQQNMQNANGMPGYPTGDSHNPDAAVQNLDPCEIEAGARLEDTIRLKGVDLLEKTLADTLGPDKHIVNDQARTNLLVKYGSSFGSADGLSYGDTYGDTHSEKNMASGYMLALQDLAANAALKCEAEKSEKCACADEASAAAMMKRAIPYRLFCGDKGKAMISNFAKLCASDYKGAISSLIGSTAFAKRN